MSFLNDLEMWTYRKHIKPYKFDWNYNTNILTSSGQLYLYKFLSNFRNSPKWSSNLEDIMFSEINELLSAQENQLYDPENLWNIFEHTQYKIFVCV